ncbi:MAG: hypothetical protein ACRDPA_21750 [Solirubrobacteraceae bacterium]
MRERYLAVGSVVAGDAEFPGTGTYVHVIPALVEAITLCGIEDLGKAGPKRVTRPVSRT